MITLEVGKRYRNREGDIVKISFDRSINPVGDYDFYEKNGVGYMADGRFIPNMESTKYDLIEEVKEDIYA